MIGAGVDCWQLSCMHNSYIYLQSHFSWVFFSLHTCNFQFSSKCTDAKYMHVGQVYTGPKYQSAYILLSVSALGWGGGVVGWWDEAGWRSSCGRGLGCQCDYEYMSASCMCIHTCQSQHMRRSVAWSKLLVHMPLFLLFFLFLSQFLFFFLSPSPPPFFFLKTFGQVNACLPKRPCVPDESMCTCWHIHVFMHASFWLQVTWSEPC